jgi:hypothetical protein
LQSVPPRTVSRRRQLRHCLVALCLAPTQPLQQTIALDTRVLQLLLRHARLEVWGFQQGF